MSEAAPGVVIDIPAGLWDAAREGIDSPALASVMLDAVAGEGSWLEKGDEFALSLSRPDKASAAEMRSRGLTPEDQLTGFLAFLELALVWSDAGAKTIVLKRADSPLSATYREGA